MNRIALVTGGNKGIGYAVVRHLAKAGCRVILAARDLQLGHQAVDRLKSLDNVSATFVQLDLNDSKSIESAKATIDKDFGKLDILINNAAMVVRGEDGLPTKTTANALQRAMDTNFIGTFNVTQAMIPLLRKSGSGSIVNVSSGLASLEVSSGPHLPAEHRRLGYAASKAALNMLTCHLAFELRKDNIRVNSADPGYTATDLTDHAGFQSVDEGAEIIVKLTLENDGGATGQFLNRFSQLAW